MNKFLLKSSVALMTALFAASSATFASWNMGPYSNGNGQPHVKQAQPMRPNPLPGRVYQGVCFEEDFSPYHYPTPYSNCVHWSFRDGILRLDSDTNISRFYFDMLEEWDKNLPLSIVPNTRVLVIGSGISCIQFQDPGCGPETIKDIYVNAGNTDLVFYTYDFPEDCKLNWGQVDKEGNMEKSISFKALDDFLKESGLIACSISDISHVFDLNNTEIHFDPNTDEFLVGSRALGGTATYRYVNGQFVTVRPFIAFPNTNNAEDAPNDEMSEDE